MKKRMSRILSALLVSALVMSAGNVVQAEDAGVTGKPKVEAEAIAGQDSGAQAIGTKGTLDAAKEITTKATDPTIGSIPLNKVTTGNENVENFKVGDIAYSNTSTYRKGKDTRYGYSQKVTLTKGTLELAVRRYYGSERVYFGVYKDAGLTQAVDSYSFVDSVRGSRVFKVSKGTYYIGVYSDVYSLTPEGSAIIGAYVVAQFCDGSDRTLTSGKQVAVGVRDAQTTYFKFVVKKAGYITVPCVDSYATSYSVTLCNSKKKALSGTTPLRYDPTYGVKKGTYYIKVKSSYNSSGYYNFKVTSNSSIKEKSGKSKAKAVTIKKKATKKGTIQAGSSQADWYKFNKTSKAKTTINIKGRTNDKIKITLYRGSKKIASGTFSYTHGGYKFTMSNYPKGTYYIKIERGTKKSSGWYSVKWS